MGKERILTLKRFTETTKWEKDWFCNLSVKHKCLWGFLCDRCDCAGIWEPNFRLATYLIGEPIEEQDLHQMSGRVMRLACGKYLVLPFVQFQYGELSAECSTHLAVLRRLNRVLSPSERVKLGYAKGLATLKDKDKDKDKALEGGAGETTDAAIPTVAEVVAFCGMGANIPADFARHYHESKEIKKTWLNGYGRLVDWKREIVKWWAGSKDTWGKDKNYAKRNRGEDTRDHAAGF